jgi:hypothetical protein
VTRTRCNAPQGRLRYYPKTGTCGQPARAGLQSAITRDRVKEEPANPLDLLKKGIGIFGR